MNFPGPAYRYTPEEMARKVYGSVKTPASPPEADQVDGPTVAGVAAKGGPPCEACLYCGGCLTCGHCTKNLIFPRVRAWTKGCQLQRHRDSDHPLGPWAHPRPGEME